MAIQSWDWVFYALGWALAGLGVLLGLWALFWDRSRGCKRCPKCWYSMEGALRRDDGSFICPECGRAAPNEGEFSRTRRHKRVATAAAALAIVGIVVRSIPGYSEHGWPGAVPSEILIRIADTDAVGTPVFTRLSGLRATPATQGVPASVLLSSECWRRFDDDTLSARQSRIWYGRYLRTQADELNAGYRLPERWPEKTDVPMAVSTRPFGRLHGPPEVSIRARNDEEWEPMRSSSFNTGERAIVVFDHRPHEWEGFEVELRRNGERLHRIPVARGFWPAGTVSTFLKRIEGSDVDDRVFEALRPRLVHWADGTEEVIFNDRRDDAIWRAIDYAIAFDLEVVVGGTVIGRGAGATEWSRPVWKDWEECGVEWVEGGLERALADPDAVEFVIRADPQRAGRLYLNYPFNKPSASCWFGEIRVPGSLEER